MSNTKINPLFTANHSLSPKLVLMNNSRIRLEFKRTCLKQNKVVFTLNNVADLFIVYELDTCSRNLIIGFALKDCLFGSVKLNKNADPDKYKYNDCDIGFDLTDGSVGKNVIIFGLDISSSVHIDDKNKDILILGKKPTQGLDDTRITAEA